MGISVSVLMSRFSIFPGRTNRADVLQDSEPRIYKMVNGVQMLDDSNSRMLFGHSYSRLQHLKAQYDPQNVLSKWVPDRPQS